MHALQIPYSLLYGAACKNRLSRVIYRFCFRCRCFRCRHVLLLVLSSITFSTAARHFLKGTDEKVCRGGKGAPVLPEIIAGSAAGLDLLYGGPVRECYAAPLFVVMLPPLLRGLMVRYDGC